MQSTIFKFYYKDLESLHVVGAKGGSLIMVLLYIESFDNKNAKLFEIIKIIKYTKKINIYKTSNHKKNRKNRRTNYKHYRQMKNWTKTTYLNQREWSIAKKRINVMWKWGI